MRNVSLVTELPLVLGKVWAKDGDEDMGMVVQKKLLGGTSAW